MTVITQDEVAKAMREHAEASDLRRRAEKMEKDAREVILAFRQQQQQEDYQFKIVLDGYETEVTVPYSAPVPAHFDQSKADDLRNFLHDTYPQFDAEIEAYFDVVYTFDLDRFLDGGKMLPVDLLHAIAEGARRRMIPTQDGQPMAPRVKSKKVKDEKEEK